MYNIFCLFFTIAVFWIDLAKGHGRCTLDVRGVDLRKMPLAYKKDGTGTAFLIYPETDGHFTVDMNSKIVLSCVNSTFSYNRLSGIKEIEVTCLSGTMFIYNNQFLDYTQFICKEILLTTTRSFNLICQRPNGNTLLNVGYQTKYYYFTVYSVCFDRYRLNTLYTWYKARVPYYDMCQDQNRVGFFSEEIFGTLNLHAIYDTTMQMKTINGILKYVPSSRVHMDNNTRFLTKGHLSARSDFHLAHEQAASFSYLNIFPQWNISNNLWNRIERAIRLEMAKSRNSKRVIVTGVHGLFKLRDRSNVRKVLYLTTQWKVSVPQFQWKMIYDATNANNSVVYIAYNNPTYATPNDLEGQVICTHKTCPEGANASPPLKLYCCDITSFQRGYGLIPDYVFNVEQGVPAP